MTKRANLLEKLNRIFPNRKKAMAIIIGNKSLKKTIININLIIIITVTKAATEAARNLKKTVYLFITAIAINAANKAILQKNANRKAIFTLTPSRP